MGPIISSAQDWLASDSLTTFASGYASCDTVTALLVYMHLSSDITLSRMRDTHTALKRTRDQWFFSLARGYVIDRLNNHSVLLKSMASDETLGQIVLDSMFRACMDMM